jgi:hypothetical protein
MESLKEIYRSKAKGESADLIVFQFTKSRDYQLHVGPLRFNFLDFRDALACVESIEFAIVEDRSK